MYQLCIALLTVAHAVFQGPNATQIQIITRCNTDRT